MLGDAGDKFAKLQGNSIWFWVSIESQSIIEKNKFLAENTLEKI